MQDKKRSERDADLDAFWDIGALLPRKKPSAMPARRNTDAVEVVLSAPDATAAAPSASAHETLRIPPRSEGRTRSEGTTCSEGAPRRFIPPHTAEEMTPPVPMEEYEPADSLLHRVRLYPWKSTYHYYDEFVRDAERLLLLRGEACPAVPFFSYVPQYSQLSRAQLAWYLWWRDRFRHGEALPTDYSYLLLFIYELINLSGKTDAAQTQAYLVRLWREYRQSYSQLDSYLIEWICDYSLIHHLPPPEDLSGAEMAAVMHHCTLREFYVRGQGERGYVRALLAFGSNHAYRKSKFYTEETKEIFDRVIPATLGEVVRRMSEKGKLFSGVGMEDSRLLRDAYTGALCSYRFKRKIEVEYASFSRSHELRFLVTDILKYTENALRAHLGIRSRLSVNALPIPVRECIDAYLQTVLPSRRISRPKETVVPSYEAQYDLVSNELSLARAAEIERSSWQTTEQLIGAFEEEVAEALVGDVADLTAQEPKTEGTKTLFGGLGSQPSVKHASSDASGENDWMQCLLPYRELLRAMRSGDARALASFAKAEGMLPELLADRMNELAADGFGDVLLEETEEGYVIIEDYAFMIEEWLQEPLDSCGEER